MPQLAVVVAVVDHGVVEMHLGELVALAAGFGDVGQRQCGDFAGGGVARRHEFVEALHKFTQIRVGVAVPGVIQRGAPYVELAVGCAVRTSRFQQGARNHGQTMAQAGGGFRVAGRLDRFGVQTEEEAAQAGVFAHQQGFNAAVFEEFDRHALERAPVIGDLRLAPAAVSDDMRQGGAVAVEAGNAPYADVLVHIRQADAEFVVVRNRFAQFVEGGGVGDELFGVIPQAAQVKIELAFHIDQQGAVALALQDGHAVGGLQAEVVFLALRVVVVVADAVIHPVFQPDEGELVEQARRLGEKLRQAGAGEGGVMAVDGAGGALGQVGNNGEVVVQLPGGGQATRHGGQVLQQGVDGAAIGRALQLAHQLHHLGQAVFAHGSRHGRPFFQKNEHRLRAASEFAQGACGIQVNLHAMRAQAGDGLGHAGLENAVHLRKAGIEPGAIGVELFAGDGGHGVLPDPAG